MVSSTLLYETINQQEKWTPAWVAFLSILRGASRKPQASNSYMQLFP